MQTGRDVTIISYGYMVSVMKEAAQLLQQQGISAELIDLRTVAPIDIGTVIQSVQKTGRAVIVQEAQKQAGIAKGLASDLQEATLYYLKAPIQIVAAPDTTYAFAAFEQQ